MAGFYVPIFIISSVFFFTLSVSSSSSNNSNFNNSGTALLSESETSGFNYTVSWAVFDYGNASSYIELFLSVQVQPSLLLSPSWVGFGLSEVGSMIGSDIVIVYENALGAIVSADNYVPWAADPLLVSPMPAPTLDEYQDWRVLCFSSSYTTLNATITRLLQTDDAQDRPIVPGPMHSQLSTSPQPWNLTTNSCALYQRTCLPKVG